MYVSFLSQLINANGSIIELIDISDDLLYLISHNISLSGHVIAAVELVQDLMLDSTLDNEEFDQIEIFLQVRNGYFRIQCILPHMLWRPREVRIKEVQFAAI